MIVAGFVRRLAFAAALFLSACAAASAPAPAPPPAQGPLADRIRAHEFGDVHSLLIYRDGLLATEWYFDGQDERRGLPLGLVHFDAETLHDARSVTKTVVALLFGAAMRDGRIASLDAPALDSFPDYADLRTPERLRIKLRDLLSMTSGFAWDEDTLPYEDARNSERMMDAAPDAYRYVLAQPIAHPPGEIWRYSGGDVMVIARVIERAVGEPLDVYAQRVLFTSLGITRFQWLKNAHGQAIAASGLRLTPRDMGKIGLLIAAHGQWNGAQLLPADWIDAMTTPHAIVGGDPPCGTRYGYFTWLGAVCAEGAPPGPFYAGIGYGGQRLVIVPGRHLVIVTTAGNYTNRAQSTLANNLLRAAMTMEP